MLLAIVSTIFLVKIVCGYETDFDEHLSNPNYPNYPAYPRDPKDGLVEKALTRDRAIFDRIPMDSFVAVQFAMNDNEKGAEVFHAFPFNATIIFNQTGGGGVWFQHFLTRAIVDRPFPKNDLTLLGKREIIVQSDSQWEPWSILWYIGSFGGLIAFFLIVSCSEWCCRKRARGRPAPATRFPIVTPPTEAPPPSYDLFAPPSYDSLCYIQEKRPFEVYVVPVHAYHPPSGRGGEDAAPPHYVAGERECGGSKVGAGL